MKRTLTSIFAIMLALVMVLSLAACGNSEKSEEEIQKEKEAINRTIQGTWISNLSEDIHHGIQFNNGKYEFAAVMLNYDITNTETGTYEINPISQEILCTASKNGGNKDLGDHRTFTYTYDDSKKLKIYNSSNDEFEKVN